MEILSSAVKHSSSVLVPHCVSSKQSSIPCSHKGFGSIFVVVVTLARRNVDHRLFRLEFSHFAFPPCWKDKLLARQHPCHAFQRSFSTFVPSIASCHSLVTSFALEWTPYSMLTCLCVPWLMITRQRAEVEARFESIHGPYNKSPKHIPFLPFQ